MQTIMTNGVTLTKIRIKIMLIIQIKNIANKKKMRIKYQQEEQKTVRTIDTMWESCGEQPRCGIAFSHTMSQAQVGSCDSALSSYE